MFEFESQDQQLQQVSLSSVISRKFSQIWEMGIDYFTSEEIESRGQWKVICIREIPKQAVNRLFLKAFSVYSIECLYKFKKESTEPDQNKQL